MSGWGDVGGNPAPGSPDAMRLRAADERDLATMLHELTQALAAIHRDAGSYSWTGAGADAVGDRLAEPLPAVVGLREMHANVAAAVGTYASGLEDRQARAVAALARFETASATRDAAAQAERAATDQVRTLEWRITSLEAEIRVQELLPSSDPATLDSLRRSLRRAKSELLEARDRRRAANTQHAEAALDRGRAQNALDVIREEQVLAASAAAAAIYEASGLQPPNSNPLLRFVGETVAEVTAPVTAFAHEFFTVETFERFLDLCDKFADALSVIALVAAFVPIPGLQQLAWVILALKVVSLAGRVGLAANGRDAWDDVKSHAVDVGVSLLFMGLTSSSVLGRMSTAGKSGFEAAGKGGAVNEFTSVFKRASFYQNASDAPGWLHTSVAVAPKLDKLPTWAGQTWISVAAVARGVDTGKSVIDTAVKAAEWRYPQLAEPSPWITPPPAAPQPGRTLLAEAP